MELAHIFCKELPIDGDNVFTTNLNEKSLLKEEKKKEHAYSLKFHNFEDYEKVITLTKNH